MLPPLRKNTYGEKTLQRDEGKEWSMSVSLGATQGTTPSCTRGSGWHLVKHGVRIVVPPFLPRALPLPPEKSGRLQGRSGERVDRWRRIVCSRVIGKDPLSRDALLTPGV